MERIPLPWSRSCFVCGEANPQGLRARSYKVGETVHLPFTAEERFAGWAGVVHGGLVATVLDEVMTWSAILALERPCYAAEFTVRLLRPLPPGTACAALGETGRAGRRLVETAARLEGEDGTLYARGEGRYMPVPAESARHLRHDFVQGEGCLDVREWFGL